MVNENQFRRPVIVPTDLQRMCLTKIRMILTISMMICLFCHSVSGFTNLCSTYNVRSRSIVHTIRINCFPIRQHFTDYTRRCSALHSAVVTTEDSSSFDEEINNKSVIVTPTDTDKVSMDNNDTVNNTLEVADNETMISIPPIWPCNDELDRRLIALSLPVIANFAIGPLIGAVDLFWVNRMGNALAVAGQAAANQVFNSVFWLTSFLPSVTATLISKENAQNNTEGVQNAICQALVVGFFMALVSFIVLLSNPEQVLSSVLPNGAPALQYAKPYLLIRSFAFIPASISLIGFSAFRGILDTLTPVKISLFANVFNAILDPILIFTFAMGVPGGMYIIVRLFIFLFFLVYVLTNITLCVITFVIAALATLGAEVISACTFLYLLRKRKMIQFRKIFQIPKWSKLEPLLRGGAALQLRNVALNISFLAVARVTQTIDKTGVAAAAHAMAIQVFQVGGIVLLALSTVSQIMVPNDLVERYDTKLQKHVGGVQYTRATVNRLMSWGVLLGIALGSVQILLLPAIRSSTPIQAVRDAALIPALLASLYQVMNGLVFIGEGVMVGTGSFFQLSISTVIATFGLLWALKVFPPIYGLTGVWLGFGVFNVLRLAGVMIHHFINGPLVPRKNLQAIAAK
jgi:multidrug resistance protein, MATE family